MNQKHNRRDFLKTAALSGIGLGIAANLPTLFGDHAARIIADPAAAGMADPLSLPFIPNRTAAWWCLFEDLQWPERKITDKIKRRAEGFAKAKIDTAINFGFHIRFDFANYFSQLHGYYANVCEELHRYGIKFMDHYSCNHTVRPKTKEELAKLYKWQRHMVLFPDPVAAPHAQYEGHLFNDICEVNILDGSRGYTDRYQLEIFCPNKPGFRDMHAKYLTRLFKEVPIDGIEVDDMCDYAGLITCGCEYCRERLRKDYGREIPPFSDQAFWGDTSPKDSYLWGNYENPAFRDWLRMKSDSYVDLIKLTKETIGNKPLMTCVSNAGPIILNSIALNVEKMAPYLDFFMLENVGINIRSVNWMPMDAEALIQKDVAEKRGHAPAIALSYTIYPPGGYLGWSLSRFWGVANWASTLDGGLAEDPPDEMETEDIISPSNNWEIRNSPLNYRDGKDLAEVRLVSSLFCRENGWRNTEGHEQWDSVKAWSSLLIKNNICYRILRYEELADAKALCAENTPLILDNLGCISGGQLAALKTYLSKGGTAWLASPFGVKDEKGFKRAAPLSVDLIKGRYRNLFLTDSAIKSDPLQKLIAAGKFHPAIRQVSGDPRWAVRVRSYNGKAAFHFLNTAMTAVPHPTIKDMSGTPILKDIGSLIRDNRLQYEINSEKIRVSELAISSPELGEEKRPVGVRQMSKGVSGLSIDLDGVKVYAVAQ